MNKTKFSTILCATALLLMAGTAWAAPRQIGKPLERDEMVIVIQYIQAVTMDGMDHSGHAGGGVPGDAHLEAIVYASKNSRFGFQPGDWMPYLEIRYEVIKESGDFRTDGRMQPMLAVDGPHYGANLNLGGPGKYKLLVHFVPPSTAAFPRHTDKETGAADWWKPFTEEYEFVFVGSVGKKGGY